MIEVILSIFAVDIPYGQNRVDVSERLCAVILDEDLDLEIPGLSRKVTKEGDMTIVSFTKPRFLWHQELRIVLNDPRGDQCKAYLFMHTF